MDGLYFDFSKDRDVEQIAARILKVLQKDPTYASRVLVKLLEKGPSGRVKAQRDWNVTNAPDLDALATIIANFVGQYINGRSGYLYEGAEVVIPRSGPMTRRRKIRTR
jgi:hypothetical protein